MISYHLLTWDDVSQARPSRNSFVSSKCIAFTTCCVATAAPFAMCYIATSAIFNGLHGHVNHIV